MRKRSTQNLNGNSGKSSCLGWFVCLLLSLVSMANAHSDPWGDIHPQVTVIDGKFSITFNSSQADRQSDYTGKKPVQQMIYTAEGKLFAPRHSLKRKRAYGELGPVGLYGRKMRLNESTVIFQGDQSGKPGYLLKSPEGKITRVRLPWPQDVSLSLLDDVSVTPEGIAITGKEGNPNGDGGPLKFYWFAHNSTETPTILSMGSTACIYNFPVASNIVFAGGRFWVACMRPTEKEELRLSLWSWKPGDKKARVEDLDSPADWNSHLSMAAIGDRLCLAYHCVADHRYPGNARIETVFRLAK